MPNHILEVAVQNQRRHPHFLEIDVPLGRNHQSEGAGKAQVLDLYVLPECFDLLGKPDKILLRTTRQPPQKARKECQVSRCLLVIIL